MVTHLDQLLARGPQVLPAVNQVQANPLHSNAALAAFCRSHDIAVTGWSPLGLGGALSEAPILEAAERHGASAGAVALKWLWQNGIAPIPRSVNPERMEYATSHHMHFLATSPGCAVPLSLHLSPASPLCRENFRAVAGDDFTLSAAEMSAIDACDKHQSVFGPASSPENIA